MILCVIVHFGTTFNKTLLILKDQNLDIAMDGWKALRVGKVLNGRFFVTICIDKEGLELLEKKNHILHMAMRNV